MGYKTILVHVSNLDRSKEILNVAVMMAKKYDAHLIGLFVVPGIQIYPSAGIYIPSEVLLPHKKYYFKQAEKIKSLFDKTTKSEGISAEWRQFESHIPNLSQIVIDNAHTADLVILGQADEENDDANIREVPGDVLMECGRPILMIPYSGSFATIGDHILVGWNGSREAARAAFDALPLLKSASKVHVHWAVATKSDTDERTLLGTDLAATLARHNINVSAETEVNPDLSDGDELLSYVAQRGADLLVMGGYGRSRTREFIFGGATKHILNHMIVPVLMSH
ncbi:universal stress protein [Sneathiella sp.]|uniref:universal stress protein n=1 Tax=Sneathiella sp. TaxID=1964365 RepID=UPI003569C7F2